MARIPEITTVPGPASLRGGGPMAAVDTSGLERGRAQFAGGLQNLASGMQSLSASAGQIAMEEKKKQNVADIAKAEALWTAGTLDIGNRAESDGDWRTYDKRYGAEISKLKDSAGALIRDEETRSRFLEQTELRRMATMDSIGDRARNLSQQEDRVSFEEAISTSATLISNPETGPISREKARRDVAGSIDVARETGLITPLEAANYKEKYITQAERTLEWNTIQRDMIGDPDGVRRRLGVSTMTGGSDLANAAITASGGAISIPYDVAVQVADAIGDTTLPSDPELAEAYLKDPEKNAEYAAVVMQELTDRFKGDMTAAVIATAPGGSVGMANAWVKSGRLDQRLPPKVRDHVRKVMAGVTSESDRPNLPVVAGDGVNLAELDVPMLDRFEKMQTAFGTPLPIVAGEGRSMEVDMSKLSEPERVRLIEVASAMGFGGIGVSDGRLQLDAGERRAWGVDGAPVPAWAEDAVTRHSAGVITEIAPTIVGLDPSLSNLTYEDRLKLDAAARAESDRQNQEMQGGIAIAAQNAPSAIARNGFYDGYKPTVDDFVKAYGPVEGIPKFKEYDSAIEVAEGTFGARTMSNDELADWLESNVPTSTGDMAGIEAQQFDKVAAIVTNIKEQRDADPNGYVVGVFPAVKAAWDNVETPEQLTNAITLTVAAQQKLGIAVQPLPKAMAANVAATFNNVELPAEQRLGALNYVIGATADDASQGAIFKQLVAAGVPEYLQGAFFTSERGDTAGASRLFAAAMTDPDKLGVLPNAIKDTEVKEKVRDAFEENQMGDVIHNLSEGTPENLERVRLDMDLMERSVRMRLQLGEAKNVDDAVKKAVADMYGDVAVVTGKSRGPTGVKITLPKDEPSEPVVDGLNILAKDVRDTATALFNSTAPAYLSGPGAKVFAFQRDAYINKLMSEGYFHGDKANGFVFIDPDVGEALPGPDGQPLRFSYEDALQAEASGRAAVEFEQSADPLSGVSMVPDLTP